jgi:putative glutamine amidotransferase
VSNHPIIGITADYQEKVNCYSKYPWFALRKHYTSCLEILGCMPIILPPSKNFENIDFLDGLLISGGDFDIDPSFYDQKIKSKNVKTIPKRTEFEMDLINLFIQSQKPILGICGGSQLINVYFNGTLIQDIETNIKHEQPNPRNETSHEIILEESSYFKKFNSSDKIYVNSAHHQAVDKLGIDLMVDAKAPDGIIEAFHHISHYYCMGIQWHPEFLITDFDKRVIKDFVENVKKNIK